MHWPILVCFYQCVSLQYIDTSSYSSQSIYVARELKQVHITMSGFRMVTKNSRLKLRGLEDHWKLNLWVNIGHTLVHQLCLSVSSPILQLIRISLASLWHLNQLSSSIIFTIVRSDLMVKMYCGNEGWRCKRDFAVKVKSYTLFKVYSCEAFHQLLWEMPS